MVKFNRSFASSFAGAFSAILFSYSAPTLAVGEYITINGTNCMPNTIPQSEGMIFNRFGILNNTGSDRWVTCPVDPDGDPGASGLDATNNHTILVTIEPGLASDNAIVRCVFRNYSYNGTSANRTSIATKTIGDLRISNLISLPDVLGWYWGSGNGYNNSVSCKLPNGSGVRIIKVENFSV